MPLHPYFMPVVNESLGNNRFGSRSAASDKISKMELEHTFNRDSCIVERMLLYCCVNQKGEGGERRRTTRVYRHCINLTYNRKENQGRLPPRWRPAPQNPVLSGINWFCLWAGLLSSRPNGAKLQRRRRHLWKWWCNYRRCRLLHPPVWRRLWWRPFDSSNNFTTTCRVTTVSRPAIPNRRSNWNCWALRRQRRQLPNIRLFFKRSSNNSRRWASRRLSRRRCATDVGKRSFCPNWKSLALRKPMAEQLPLMRRKITAKCKALRFIAGAKTRIWLRRPTFDAACRRRRSPRAPPGIARATRPRPTCRKWLADQLRE